MLHMFAFVQLMQCQHKFSAYSDMFQYLEKQGLTLDFGIFPLYKKFWCASHAFPLSFNKKILQYYIFYKSLTNWRTEKKFLSLLFISCLFQAPSSVLVNYVPIPSHQSLVSPMCTPMPNYVWITLSLALWAQNMELFWTLADHMEASF